jgi:competence protein ComEC
MEKPKLFEDRKSFSLTMSVLLLLLLIHLVFRYTMYREFIHKPFYFTHAKVLSAYTKHKRNRSYQVLKLRSDDGLTFYTTTHEKEDLTGYRLRLQLFPVSTISFFDYLGSFYIKSRIKKKEKLSSGIKDVWQRNVMLQHNDPKLGTFYNAIFFASPLSKELRHTISLLGISHLVALSGFHLGILWGLVYSILLILYRPLQQHYFPYRYALADIGLVTVVILGIYVWFVGAPPSLLRSYAMVLIGWSMLLMGVELLSFTFLATVTVLLTVLFPSLLVSLGFWFSIAGVYFIFLLLCYTHKWQKWHISLYVIPIGIFLLMLPVVHFFFPVTSPYQMLSPLLSLLFVPFYPLAILLHLIGEGSIFDTALEWLFSLPEQSTEQLLSVWLFGAYVVLALGAARSKILFYMTLGTALLYAGILFI